MLKRRALLVTLAPLLALLAACGRDATAPSGTTAGASVPRFLVTPASAPLFHANGATLGRPATALLIEADGGLAVLSQASYDHFWSAIAPSLVGWSADPRLDLNPNYVAAILTKESGFDTLAVSWMPANGLAQMTHVADLDLQQMVDQTTFSWMQPEVLSWPRNGAVHSYDATREQTLLLLSQGRLTSANEYFFNGLQIVRAQLFWLRLLENKWTTDEWPGGYGTFARDRINAGAPLTESQLVDLVTVSYNQGYDWVYNLVNQYGASWTSYIAAQGAAGAEAADYLDRVRNFTGVYQDAAASTTSATSATSATASATTVPVTGTDAGV